MKNVLPAFPRCLLNNGAAFAHIPLHALLAGPVRHFFASSAFSRAAPLARPGSRIAPVQWLPWRRRPLPLLDCAVSSSLQCQTESEQVSPELTLPSCLERGELTMHLYSTTAAEDQHPCKFPHKLSVYRRTAASFNYHWHVLNVNLFICTLTILPSQEYAGTIFSWVKH